jgi:acyl-CoA synthetase (AMP-forming)/AMP-acid ligase II
MTPRTLLQRAVQSFPQRTAILDGSLRFTYRQFDDRTSRLANSLTDVGLKKGDRVAFLMPNCHQALETDAACYKAGFVKVPLNARLSTGELVHMMNNSGTSALVVHRNLVEGIQAARPQIETVRHFIVTSGSAESMLPYEELVSGGSPRRPSVELSPEDLYGLFYTSGTTGVLKAAMITYRNYIATTRYWLHHGLAPGDDLAVGYVAPVTHAASLLVLPTLIRGGINVLLSSFDPETLLRTVQTERITDLFLIPVMINLLMEHRAVKDFNLSSLRNITYGAAPMAPDRIHKALEIFGPILRQAYGQTESTGLGTLLSVDDHVTGGDPKKIARLASAGQPVSECEVRVIDESGNDVTNGEAGEILLRGDSVMAGYWNAPELSASTVVNGWLHTRDMGRFDEDGYLFLVDRKSDMVISGGFNIYPNEVEHVLVSHPAVFEAAVVGVPDELWGEAVKAVVVLREGERATEGELIEYCRQRLASYKKPKSVDFVRELPRNPSGKLLRRLVREPYWAGRERRVG